MPWRQGPTNISALATAGRKCSNSILTGSGTPEMGGGSMNQQDLLPDNTEKCGPNTKIPGVISSSHYAVYRQQ